MNELWRSIPRSRREAILVAIGAVVIIAVAAIVLRVLEGSWPKPTFGLGIAFATAFVWWIGRSRRAEEEREEKRLRAAAQLDQKTAE
ncbi:MAG: hypothetical protein KIS83_07965 [Rubrivivax sp.]|nr:hypothetical protein [Rubrivivax sp.]